MTRATVLVSGAGIAGLTAACALRQHGFEVELVETKPTLTDDGGIGLTLVGNALRALDGIGLARPIMAGGVSADHLRLCDPAGRLLREQPTTGPWGEGLPGHCSVSRRHLHATLVQQARERGVRLRTGVRIMASAVAGEGISVDFSDGTRGSYALCAAAEGLFSAARARLFPAVQPVPSGQGSWRARVSRPAGLDTSEIYLGGRYGVVGICPVSATEAYLYIVEAAEADHREDDTTLHHTLRARLDGVYGGRIPALLDELTDPREVSYRPLPGLIAPDPWHAERTVLIGDAAHANPPVLAQGAAMGIEDAVVLAEELARHEGQADAALPAFMARRYERARDVVESSLQLARWEVEHTRDADVPGLMSRVSRMLGAPI
jgi:2-polyprenyl-6-methoxyphenol hydroxylase-like FAD-dependent oxidoreductase